MHRLTPMLLLVSLLPLEAEGPRLPQAPIGHLRIELHRERDATGAVNVVIAGAGRRDAVAVIVAANEHSADVPVPFAWQTISCDGSVVLCSSPDAPPGTPLVRLRVFRKAILRGQIKGPWRAGTPMSALIMHRPAGTALPERGSQVVQAAPITHDGRFELGVPGGRIDIRLHAEGCASIYRFDVLVEQRADIGAVECVPGGYLTARVRDAAGGAEVSGCVATLRRQSPVPSLEWDVYRSTSMNHAARCDPRGFLQITGIAPGHYWLTVETTDHAPTEHEVEIAGDAESYFDVWLSAFREITVTVVPATTPSGEPWAVGIRSAVNRTRQNTGNWARARTNSDGRVTFKRMTHDAHEVEIRGADGRLMYNDVHPLPPTPDELRLVLPLVTVSGVVTRGSTPIEAATVLLANDYDQAPFVTDADGEFHGWMRRPAGPVFVDVRLAGSTTQRSLQLDPEVDGAESIRLDVRLPDTRVTVMVVDAESRPAPDTRVSLRSPTGAVIASGVAGRTGVAEFTGVDAGAYGVEATHRDLGTSDRVPIDVTDGDESAITVRLVGHGEFNVVLTSFEGTAVAGADITAMSLDGGDRRRTDAAGRARLRLTQRSAYALFRVAAPSHMLWSGCLALGPDASLTIRLPPTVTGTAEVRPRQPLVSGLGLWLVNDEGGAHNLADLGAWRVALGLPYAGELLQGQPAEVPRLAAGFYRLVWWPANDRAGLVAALCARTMPAATGVYVGPGAAVVIEAPAPR